MDYLKEYNITESQIELIKIVLKEKQITSDIFVYSPERVEEILNLFKDMGVTNFFDIIVTSPSMFCDPVRSIKTRLDKYENKEELARLINEDANNLILVDLM